MRIRPLLTALGLNAIPAFGWFIGDWSAGTTLLLYWLETLLGTLLVAVRIILHRRLVRSDGHWNYRAPQGQKSNAPTGGGSYLTAFLVPALVFALAHGFFLLVLGWIAIRNHLSPEVTIERRDLLLGLTGIALVQMVDFLTDLIGLRTRSFAWIERLGQLTLARVIVIHLTIIGGMAAVMFTGADRHFFGVFIFLKTLLNCSLVLPQYNPKTPPAWLAKAMDSNVVNRLKAPKSKKENFGDYWKQTDEQEAARIARNERPMSVTAASGR